MKKSDVFYCATRIHAIEQFLNNLSKDNNQNDITRAMATSLRADAGWLKVTVEEEMLKRIGG